MCRSMVDIQSPTAEIRRGKKEDRRKETTGQKYIGPLLYRAAITSEQQQQYPFYGPLSGTTRVSRYQKKHSPAHHPDHPVFISFFHLPRSIASSLFKLRAWQSFFHNFCPCPVWSTSWSGALYLIFHTFLHPVNVFFWQPAKSCGKS